MRVQKETGTFPEINKKVIKNNNYNVEERAKIHMIKGV